MLLFQHQNKGVKSPKKVYTSGRDISSWSKSKPFSQHIPGGGEGGADNDVGPANPNLSGFGIILGIVQRPKPAVAILLHPPTI